MGFERHKTAYPSISNWIRKCINQVKIMESQGDPNIDLNITSKQLTTSNTIKPT